jgi:TatD DNase family protein
MAHAKLTHGGHENEGKGGIALSYVDAHLHLADPGYAGRTEEVIDDAEKNNVIHLLSNAVDYETSSQTIALAKKHSPRVLAAIGVHPWTVMNTREPRLDKLELLVQESPEYIAAIGEIGLDGKYTQDQQARKHQLEVFKSCLSLAEREGLPVVVHSRSAVDETLRTLQDFRIPKVLLHWYDGPLARLDVIRERGYLISIGPAVSYSQAITEVARKMPLDMFLSETDGPVKYRGPFQGRQTRPSFVLDVVRRVAEIKGLGTEAVREAAWSNFRKFTAQ